MYYFYKTGSL
jgi:hypothetical protein